MRQIKTFKVSSAYLLKVSVKAVSFLAQPLDGLKSSHIHPVFLKYYIPWAQLEMEKYIKGEVILAVK